jgi:hypothetical protein
VAVADCRCEDGPHLEPLPVANRRGERTRRFPCKHLPVELGLDGFDIIYRLWTLPYNFLCRIVCATVSVIVRTRRGPPIPIENRTALPRSERCICLPIRSAHCSICVLSCVVALVPDILCIVLLGHADTLHCRRSVIVNVTLGAVRSASGAHY